MREDAQESMKAFKHLTPPATPIESPTPRQPQLSQDDVKQINNNFESLNKRLEALEHAVAWIEKQISDSLH